MSGEGVESQLFAKCGYLWPSSFLSSLPLSTSHSRIVLSLDPLTSCDGFVGLNWTQPTEPLPFSQMSVLLVLLYASPPLNLRLSPGEGGKDGTLGKMQSPVALELLELLARSHIPQPDAVVTLPCMPAARSEHGAVERESDVVDLGTVLVL